MPTDLANNCGTVLSPISGELEVTFPAKCPLVWFQSRIEIQSSSDRCTVILVRDLMTYLTYTISWSGQASMHRGTRTHSLVDLVVTLVHPIPYPAIQPASSPLLNPGIPWSDGKMVDGMETGVMGMTGWREAPPFVLRHWGVELDIRFGKIHKAVKGEREIKQKKIFETTLLI